MGLRAERYGTPYLRGLPDVAIRALDLGRVNRVPRYKHTWFRPARLAR
jgi:hypothetical protein